MKLGNNRISYEDTLEIAKELTGKREMVLPPSVARKMEESYDNMVERYKTDEEFKKMVDEWNSIDSAPWNFK